MAVPDERKEHFRKAHKDWASEYFQLDFGRLSDKKRSEGLIRFYLEKVHNMLYASISSEDIDAGIVDASGDLGVDFIHRDDNQVTILQAKCLGERGKVALDDIINFQTLLSRLQKGEAKKNQRLKEALADVDFERDTFLMKFLALGGIEGEAKDQSLISPDYPSLDMAERVEFQFLAEQALTEELRNAASLSTGIPHRCELFPAGKRANRTTVIELSDSPYRSVVIVVDAMQLVELYKQHKDSLFTLNIRNYLGNTSTNRLLLETLKSDPGNFYYFNNGVSCLAEGIAVNEDRIVATKFQIINGAQTVRSLHKVFKGKANKERLKEAMVLVRITEAGPTYGSSGRFRNDIVRYNNTQNVIKVSDFKSNDPIHEDLKKRFGQHKRNGKPVCYVSKRSDPRDNRNSWIIPLEEFSKVAYSFLRDPISFSGSTSFLFDDTEKGGYVWIFGDGQTAYTTMPEDAFKLRAAAWWLAQAFAEQIKIDRVASVDPLVRAALERKWFLLFIAKLALIRSYGGQEVPEDFLATYKGDWKFGEGSTGKWLSDLYSISKEILIYLYKEAAKEQTFVHRNWMRSRKTVAQIETYLSEGPMRLARKA